ncbi:uncharacterized protein [Panulirus ornatus]|uniref:uncharacterized protein n=1 Tax=Panulirus ornatus TaxID=150431 RepID=UPI003A871095
MLRGTTVYLGNRLSLDYLLKIRFTRRRVSRVRILKEFYGAYNVGVGLQKRSALRRKFDQLMYRIQQSGLVRKFIDDSLRLHVKLNKDLAHEEEGESGDEQGGGGEVIPLSLDSIQGLFLITLFGWLCGFLSFMIEKTIVSR